MDDEMLHSSSPPHLSPVRWASALDSRKEQDSRGGKQQTTVKEKSLLNRKTSYEEFAVRSVYVCPECNFWSQTLFQFRHHVVDHIGAEKSNPPPYICSSCKQEFRNHTSVKSHVNNRRNQKDSLHDHDTKILIKIGKPEDSYASFLKDVMVAAKARSGKLPSPPDETITRLPATEESGIAFDADDDLQSLAGHSPSASVTVLSDSEDDGYSGASSSELSPSEAKLEKLIQVILDDDDSPPDVSQFVVTTRAQDEKITRPSSIGSDNGSRSETRRDAQWIPRTSECFIALADEGEDLEKKGRIKALEREIPVALQRLNEAHTEFNQQKATLKAKIDVLVQSESEHQKMQAESIQLETRKEELIRRLSEFTERKHQSEKTRRTLQWEAVELSVARAEGHVLTPQEEKNLAAVEEQIRYMEMELNGLQEKIQLASGEQKNVARRSQEMGSNLAQSEVLISSTRKDVAAMKSDIENRQVKLRELQMATEAKIKNYAALELERARDVYLKLRSIARTNAQQLLGILDAQFPCIIRNHSSTAGSSTNRNNS